MTAPVGDGRRDRRTHNTARIVGACRELMSAGTFQPKTAEVAATAGVSARCVFLHFETMHDLYREALKDDPLRSMIAYHVFGPCLMTEYQVQRVVAAVVFGERYRPIESMAESAPAEQAAAA